MSINTPRSINSQLSYAISKSGKFGQSKKTDKRNPDHAAKGGLYSVGRTEDIRATANAFAAYLNANHSKLKYVYQIQPGHAQGFLDTMANHGRGWTIATGEEMVSRMNKLSEICREAFSLGHDFSEGIRTAYKHERKVRDKAMTEEHYGMLLESFRSRDSHCAGRTALEITYRVGARVNEDACLRPQDIDVENARLYISPEGAKGGKARTLDIQPGDIPFFRRLKDETEGKDYCLGVKPGSINRAIREEMRKISIELNGVSMPMSQYYERTTIHSVRKLWARKRYFGLLKKVGVKPDLITNSPGCRRAWNIVKAELGHGKDMRKSLFATYIGDPFLAAP